MKQKILQSMFAVLMGAAAQAQINTGSNGSDGAFNPATNTVINMADHPNGIYQYTSVNIPTNVTVTFIPNANNTPVYWLVQSNVVINGIVSLAGQDANNSTGGIGGPGGWQGGHGGPSPTAGQGPGGGSAVAGYASNASYNYGNIFLLPLLGGSGGGGSSYSYYSLTSNGGGGGGALLIGASNNIQVGGRIWAGGGSGYYWAGGGSGGAVRLVASRVTGIGSIDASGGHGVSNDGGGAYAGSGRIRFDTYDNEFSGGVSGQFTSGSQFIIIPTSGQLPQLTVTSVGGVPVSASPTGALSTPDAVLSAQQNNPIPVVVSCANLPLNTQITVSVKPANAAAVSAMGYNNTGTLASSTATISIVMPRGGGLIYATAATGN